MQKNECSRLKAELEKVLGSLEDILSAASLNEDMGTNTSNYNKPVSKAVINAENCCMLSRNLLQRSIQEEAACQNESRGLVNARDTKDSLKSRVDELQAQLDSDTPPPNSITPILCQLLTQKRQFDESVRTLITISIAGAVHNAHADGS
jgi:hypothetical protein